MSFPARSRGQFSWLPGHSLLLISLLAVSCVSRLLLEADETATNPGKANAAVAEKPNPPKWTVLLRAVDVETGRPIANPTFTVQLGTDATTHKGNGRGECDVSLPSETPTYCYLKVRATGYTPMRAFWRNREGAAKDSVPHLFTFPMAKAATVGGIVINEAGETVANVTVWFSAGDHSQRGRRVNQTFYQEKYVTDKNGRWQCDIAPRNMTSASIRLDHIDYARMESTWSADRKIAELKTGEFRCVLRPAVKVKGRVTTADGKPVEGAVLAMGNFPDDEGPFFKTDKNGRYEISRAFAGDLLTVVAKGLAPEQHRLPGGDPQGGGALRSPIRTEHKTVPCPDQTIDFTLNEGHRVTFRVKDSNGKPIPDVYVAPDEWKGNRALLILRQFFMPRTTDANGELVWNGAPSGSLVTIDLFKFGYMDIRDSELKFTKDRTVEYTLKRPQFIVGKVVDAETKRPIDEFVIQKGFYWPPEDPDEESGKTAWPESDGVRYRGGKYRRSVTLPPNAGHYRFRVHAQGYESAESGPIPFTEGEFTQDFELKKKR